MQNLTLAALEFIIIVGRDFSEADLACKIAPHEALTEFEIIDISSHLIVHKTSHILSQSCAADAQY